MFFIFFSRSFKVHASHTIFTMKISGWALRSIFASHQRQQQKEPRRMLVMYSYSHSPTYSLASLNIQQTKHTSLPQPPATRFGEKCLAQSHTQRYKIKSGAQNHKTQPNPTLPFLSNKETHTDTHTHTHTNKSSHRQLAPRPPPPPLPAPGPEPGQQQRNRLGVQIQTRNGRSRPQSLLR